MIGVLVLPSGDKSEVEVDNPNLDFDTIANLLGSQYALPRRVEHPTDPTKWVVVCGIEDFDDPMQELNQWATAALGEQVNGPVIVVGLDWPAYDYEPFTLAELA